MSAPTRRKEDFNVRLPDKLELGTVDFIETRLNGYHAVFPADKETRDHMARMFAGEDPRPSILKPILIGVLILLGAFVIGWFFIG